MDTQHTSFVQPHFLISHYQILLNSIQPFRITRRVRDALLTLYAKTPFCCLHALVPGVWILTQQQSLFLIKADFRPRLSLISPSHGVHCRALYSVHQHKQVTSSQLNSVIIQCINKGCWNCNVICYRLFEMNSQIRSYEAQMLFHGDSGSSLTTEVVFNISYMLYKGCRCVQKRRLEIFGQNRHSCV